MRLLLLVYFLIFLGMAEFFPFCFNKKLFFSGHPKDDRTLPENQSQGTKPSPPSVLTNSKIQVTIQNKQQHNKPQHHFLGTLKLDF